MCLPYLLVFISLWSLHCLLLRSTKVLQKPCPANLGKFQGSDESRFDGSEKDRYFLKIPKWQHKIVQDYKLRKLVSYFLNNVTKTCLYWLKMSENIEIDHVFQFKHFFISVAISTQVASAPLTWFNSVYFLVNFSDFYLVNTQFTLSEEWFVLTKEWFTHTMSL